ncbi:sensor domain-containing phosphodiesterase [uncultured Xylophilus sp.]|uniref:sensor domain-containing phosphodiesterase n=1 Tax=uncultured Xylophilus sp. TaxID=296832 RepID=UPI0025CCBAA9|nr:sensor domain-containing phosphodiesterase [uncultured Xylophilus sp.]
MIKVPAISGFAIKDEGWSHEEERLRVLQSTRLLEDDTGVCFDEVTRIAAALFNVPVALINLIDSQSLHPKGRFGLDQTCIPRNGAFCDYTIRQSTPMVIQDTELDSRFGDSDQDSTGKIFRFYAGVPLITSKGFAVGSMCILDYQPRQFSVQQVGQLIDLAALALVQIEHRLATGKLDHITGLHNRTQLVEDIEDLDKSESGHPRSLMVMELIDHGELQDISRLMGVKTLEIFFQQIARRIAELTSDYRVRLYYVGVSRFAVLFDHAGRTDTVVHANQLILEVQQYLRSKDVVIVGGIHGGFKRIARGESGDDVIRHAFAALYEAKLHHRLLFDFNSEIDERQHRINSLIREIPLAVSEDQFSLVYQPKYNARLKKFTGVEALLRWNHPKWGFIPPSEFVPLAEATRMIQDITTWVLSNALAQLRLWKVEGHSLTVAVNVSSKNLEQPNFVDYLRSILEGNEISPASLHIECTENAVLTGGMTKGVLREIQALGCSVSLDDFGSGYCNLACLPELPAELLKIDRSLIVDIENDTRANLLIQSIISMGHAMGYRVLAEGVESKGIFDILIGMGCDAIQGYFLGKPMPPEEVIKYISNFDYESLR